MPVASVRRSLASVAFDGDFVCGTGPKPHFPPKPKPLSADLLRSVLSAGRGFAGVTPDDDWCGTKPKGPFPPRPHFLAEDFAAKQAIR
jgi:hypothetical protein